MRTPLIAANWKMNTTLADAHVLANGVRSGAEHMERIEIVLCPPTIWLTELAHQGMGPGRLPHLKLGAQNIYFEEKGAFTGETSPLMVREVAEYVLVGHSERTHIFRESLELVSLKLHAAFAHGLKPILCLGEDERTNNSPELVRRHLEKIIEDLSDQEVEELVLAYEPVWAIGSGQPATAEYAQEMAAYLRQRLSPATRIQYGGSVNEENAKGYLEQPDIDGLLIGGASLKLKSFLTICQLADDLAHPTPSNH